MQSKALRPSSQRLRSRVRTLAALLRSLGPVGVVTAWQLWRSHARDAGEVHLRTGRARSIAVRPGTTDRNVFAQHFIARELYQVPRLTEVDVIVDLGARVGIATEVLRMQYPTARIVSVEMNLDNFDMCFRNHKNTPNQETVHAAIWSESGTVTVEDAGEGNWAFRAVSTRTEDSDVPIDLKVGVTAQGSAPALSFVDFVRAHELSHISILKIDIEGSEAPLLETAWREIFGMTRLIVMEVHRSIPGCRERVEAVLAAARAEFELEITDAGEFTCIRPRARLRRESFEGQAVNA